MARFISLLAVVSTALAAQTTTVSLVFPLDSPETLYGSVINVDPEATTYAVACSSGADDLPCRILNTQTVVEGPSTVSIHYSFAGDATNGYFEEDLACKVNFDEDVATCDIEVSSGKPGGSTTTTSIHTVESGLNKIINPVTVTAGLEKLDAALTSIATSEATTTASPASSALTTVVKTESVNSEAAFSTGTPPTKSSALETAVGSSSVLLSSVGESASILPSSVGGSTSASSTPEIVNGASNSGFAGSKSALVVGMAALMAVALL